MMTRGKYVAASLGGALVAALVVFTPGCSEECVDRFDCVGKGAAGEFLVCTEGKCVVGERPDAGPPEETPDSGPPAEDAGMDAGETDAGMDAGMMDAGMMDGGETDAGMMDAGMPDSGTPMAITFIGNLSGKQEVPPTMSAATGTATCVLDAAKTSLLCSVMHTVTAPTVAHVHLGHAGLSGPPVFTFTPVTPVAFSQTFPVTAQQATDLEEGRMYVNIHTMLNPNGEIRGQLLRAGEKLYAAEIDGGTNGNGSAGFVVNSAGNTLTYDVTLNGAMGVTASHIHKKSDSSILVPLANVGNTGGFGTAPVTAADVAVLDADGGYLNVHGAGGAVIITGDVYKLQ